MRSHVSWDDTDKSIASQKFELKDVETLFLDQSPWLNPRITWGASSGAESGWDGRVWTSFRRRMAQLDWRLCIALRKWLASLCDHLNSSKFIALQKGICSHVLRSKVSSPSIFSAWGSPWQLWCLVAVSFSDSRTASELNSDGLLLFELGSVAEGTSETFWGILICQEFQCFVTTTSETFQNCQFELADAGPLIETKRHILITHIHIIHIYIWHIRRFNSTIPTSRANHFKALLFFVPDASSIMFASLWAWDGWTICFFVGDLYMIIFKVCSKRWFCWLPAVRDHLFWSKLQVSIISFHCTMSEILVYMLHVQNGLMQCIVLVLTWSTILHAFFACWNANVILSMQVYLHLVRYRHKIWYMNRS